MTDPEQAALAALVAWREKRKAFLKRANKSALSFSWLKAQHDFHAAVDELDAAADLLIAERAAAEGR